MKCLSSTLILCIAHQALLEALGAGAASDLIELDMRGNPLTVEHLTKLVRVLHKLAMVMNSKPWFSAGLQLSGKPATVFNYASRQPVFLLQLTHVHWATPGHFLSR